MANSNPVVIRENWETYSFGSEGGPVFVTFYAGAKDLSREKFPHCARVMIPIQKPNENGGPTGEEAETLWGLEDKLTEILTRHEVSCILLARMTHAGNRELVFQLADWEQFRPPVGFWMQETPAYEVDVSEHEGWDFFDDCVWPTNEDWMLIHDRRVVDGLIESGSDPAKEHSLEYAFTGQQADLKRLRDALVGRGYSDQEPSTQSDQLVMVKKLTLDLSQIFAESLENKKLCDEMGVDFDGWGSCVVK